MSLDEFKSLLEKAGNITFKEHFYERGLNRYLTTEMVKSCLNDPSCIVQADEQPTKKSDERKFRVKFKVSVKYFLNVVIVFSGKDLYIITGWRSLR